MDYRKLNKAVCEFVENYLNEHNYNNKDVEVICCSKVKKSFHDLEYTGVYNYWSEEEEDLVECDFRVCIDGEWSIKNIQLEVKDNYNKKYNMNTGEMVCEIREIPVVIDWCWTNKTSYRIFLK